MSPSPSHPQPRHRASPGSPEACLALKVKPEPSASTIVILPLPPPPTVLSLAVTRGQLARRRAGGRWQRGWRSAGPLPAVTPPAQPGDGSGRTRTLSRLSGHGRAHRERRQHPEVCGLHPAAPRCITPWWGPRAPSLPPSWGHFQGAPRISGCSTPKSSPAAPAGRGGPLGAAGVWERPLCASHPQGRARAGCQHPPPPEPSPAVPALR